MKNNMEIKNFLPNIKVSLIIFLVILTFFVINKGVLAGTADLLLNSADRALEVAGASPAGLVVVSPTANTQTTLGRLITKITAKAKDLFNDAGQKAFYSALRNTLNRVAFDAAKYVGTAGEGQKPLFVKEDFKNYITNLGDAAAGDFISSLGETWQTDLCRIADPALTAKISLGLVQYQRPQAPNCTLSELTSNYTSTYEKYAAMKNGDYLKAVQLSFEPGGGEINTTFELFNRAENAKNTEANNQILNLQVKQGWLDVTDIAGNSKNPPGQPKTELEIAKKAQTDAIANAKPDENPFISAANIFLNQLSYEAFQRVLRELGKKPTSQPYDFSSINNGSAFESLIQYGEAVVSEKLATIIKPNFNVRSDYSILSELAICPDKDNPGPNNCVIDDKFSQAIAEKVTVSEALAKGYLHGDWLVTSNNKADSAYTLRSASILRKFRIVPVGWEQAISAASAKNLKVTIADLVACFPGNGDGPFSEGFIKADQTWCSGLVDPNWVLKAPLNLCVKKGAGGQILSSLVSKDENGNSIVSVSRDSEYCADEQTCIKEKADGSCEAYGYCNEEKRTWSFNSDACAPVYNTCQTFSSASSKQPVSYLQNTLDFGTCDSSNTGCKQYVYNGAYSIDTNKVLWDKRYSIFLNNKATTCSAASEGCTELFRGKPGWSDANFIMNSNFSANSIGETSTSSNWHWPIKIGRGEIVSGKALKISGADGSALYSDNTSSLLPQNLSVITGWSYTLSAEIIINSGDKVSMTFGGLSSEFSEKNVWKTVSVVVPASQRISSLNFAITGSGASLNFSIRNLKLSPNDYSSTYKNYGAFPAYEKLMPAYLENTCYASVSGTGDYRLKADAPAICSNFARKCNREEVGCELYTSLKDSFAVAAKANSADYCDAKCVGYDTYLAKTSYFYGTSADNLIPTTAKTCSAESAGCASFTNLDSAAAGGETLEYYAKVRQCIKPDTASCGDFYSWDNSQLKVMSLKKDSGGNPFIVDALSDALCTKEIYNLAPSDPRYNPDCREFYNKSGQITYHIFSNTVSCSDTCHTYRLNEKNIDSNLVASTCTGTDKNWDATQNTCYVCKNGGLWNSKQGACLYQAMPDEGVTCSAAEVGCREYNGNNGNSLKLITAYDFETGLSGFSGVGTVVSQSLESTAKNGHSLSYSGNGAAEVILPTTIKKDSSYIIKFMAKASDGLNAKISLENSDGQVSAFGVTENNPSGGVSIKGDNQWNLYEINLRNLDHEVKAEKLKISANGNFFIDHLVLNEVSDRFYLIKGSSAINDVCYYDLAGKYQGANYNLGCSQYKDRAGTTHNLHQFTELCQDSAVGCEQMIKTNNSSDYYGYTLNLNAADRATACAPGDQNCLEVKGHQVVYAVYDPSKLCNVADLGCARFAYSQTTGATTNWVDVYKKNLPNTYKSENASPLCQASEVGCDTWADSKGSMSYFKDPGVNTCIYKNNKWLKSPVKRCDADASGQINSTEKDAAVCLSDSDCNGKKCVLDSNEYLCSVTYLKTFGFGGAGNMIATPDKAAGICDSEAATCSEYIDPLSKLVSNLVYNPAAEDIDKDGQPDKWVPGASSYYTQKVTIKPNKLYVLQVEGAPLEPTSLDSNGSLRTLGATPTNELSAQLKNISLGSDSSIVFYSGTNSFVTLSRFGVSTSTTEKKVSVSIRESIVNYQLSSNIDATSCNGVINTDGGCVLLNARTHIGNSGLNKLTFASGLEGKSTNCNGSNCAANSIIKVAADRVCSRWLSCRTYVEDPTTKEKVCYAMGECDQLNEKNECVNFLTVDGTTRDLSQSKNATGYSLLNNYYLGGMKEVGQNTSAHFDFETNSVNLSCRRDLGNNTFASDCSFSPNINESLVLGPTGSPTDYPAHGKGYLKVLNSYQMSPQSENSSIPIYSNQDYYINYLVNTKGSNASAKVLIVDNDNNNVYATFSKEESNGWSRKVHRFRVSATGLKNIKIYLSSDATNQNTGYVYFDDINIEPVLQTGANSYVSKDCRLYPADDTLSCLSTNNNVIKDGLYGYCLQYDPINPGVCLMWYPVDKIAPEVRSNQSTLGYSGKFPLYYCSEANGNFQLVEKVKVFEINHDYDNEWDTDNGNFQNVCRDLLGYNCSKADACFISKIPSKNNNGTVISKEAAGLNAITCGSDNYKLMINRTDAGKNSTYLNVFCVPNPEKILGETSEDTSINKDLYSGDQGCNFKDSWVPFDDVFVQGAISSQDNGGELSDKVKVFETVNDMAFSETNDKTNFSISNLKPLVTSDPTNYYHFTCNRFTQVVDNEGNNQAWANRVSRNSLFPTKTPDFFYNNKLGYSYVPTLATSSAPIGSCSGENDFCGYRPDQVSCEEAACFWTELLGEQIPANPHGINLYGRNREDVPFGAAVMPSSLDLLSSDRINLRNQYSKKNNETIFAGRPYGCTGNSCKYFGYCSLDPNVFCIYTDNSDVNKTGCSGGGYGSCEPLWEIKNPTLSDAGIILNRLFNKSYGDYKFSKNSYMSEGSSVLSVATSTCSGLRPNYPSTSFCSVVPSVTNLKVSQNGSPVVINNGAFTVTDGALYQLEFNSIIDFEQQPLKQIIINWGDSIQIINNLDNKPQTGKPHVFSHFYLKGTNSVSVKIIDNWNLYGCLDLSGKTGIDGGCGGL